jgi:hypothetical protein
MIPRIFLLCFCFSSLTLAARSKELFDLGEIRNINNLETRVIQDWQPNPKIPKIQQKLIEITVAEWWPGQKVRVPVTLNAPVDKALLPCRNVIVTNMGLALRTATPSGPELKLLQEKGVGVVLVGMSTIETMLPVGQLHLGMKEQLLKTKDVRFSTAWIWGMSQMRGLTAAEAEPKYFQPRKVIATGGSKRGIATAVAGIHDDRFTGIMPVVAPPLGNPGTPTGVLGTEPEWIAGKDRRFLETVDAGIRRSLLERDERREATRLTLAEVTAEGWTEKEISDLSDRLWDASRITNHLAALKKRGLAFFYNVGTNDSVAPNLLGLGQEFPDFPIYIVPGGQHGGPADAGFTRRVTLQPEVVQNFDTFCRAHFFGERAMPHSPEMKSVKKGDRILVTVSLPKGAKIEESKLSWSFNRHDPYCLPFEYDRWETIELQPSGKNNWSAEIPLPADVRSIQFLSTHVDRENGLPFAISSPLKEMVLR